MSTSPNTSSSDNSQPPMSDSEKGYPLKKEEVEEVKEERPEETRKDAPGADDCGVVKIKSKDAEGNSPKSPRNCAPEESKETGQYRHIEPHPHPHREANGTPHWYQPPDAHGQHPHPHPHPHPHAHHYPHDSHVRLPGIASLLTEPYSPHPHSPHSHSHSPHSPHPRYDDRQQQQPDWPHPHPHPHPQQPQQMPPPPEHYPPMVAPLPLDDSRARTPQPMPQRKRGRLPKETTDFLKAWLHSHAAHPYPSEIEKKQMCHATGLSMSQVSNWMINGRRRILGPSYLSTSRSNSNPHPSPPVQLSSPPVVLQSPSVMLSQPGPALMLRTPGGHQV